MTVNIEYASTEEITKEISKWFTFREVEEVSFENVFDVLWVCCDDSATVAEERN